MRTVTRKVSSVAAAILVAVLILASCAWAGGHVAIAIVARTADAVLEPVTPIVIGSSLVT